MNRCPFWQRQVLVQFDKFYIVSEAAANARPPERAGFSAQIFGPFLFGSLDNALSYTLSASQVSQLRTWQNASSFGGVVFLFLPPETDIFTSTFESFSGVRIASTP